MIKNFELFTDFKDKARKCVPFVISLLWLRYEKANGITSNAIIEAIQKEKGVKLTGADIRKIINFIRCDGIIPNLVAAGSHGYYRTNDRKELEDYIESLQGRVSAIAHLKELAENYLNNLPQSAA